MQTITHKVIFRSHKVHQCRDLEHLHQMQNHHFHIFITPVAIINAKQSKNHTIHKFAEPIISRVVARSVSFKCGFMATNFKIVLCVFPIRYLCFQMHALRHFRKYYFPAKLSARHCVKLSDASPTNVVVVLVVVVVSVVVVTNVSYSPSPFSFPSC